MKTFIFGALALTMLSTLTACAPTTLGGQFSEPTYGWQRNGTYILTPEEMEMGCDALRVEQGKAAKAIAYVDSVQGKKFGESLMITGAAALFGMVRLPDVGFEERKAKDQLRQGATAFNTRLTQLGCEASDIDGMISQAKREFRDERRAAEEEAEAAAEEAVPAAKPSRTQSFNKDDEDESADE